MSKLVCLGLALIVAIAGCSAEAFAATVRAGSGRPVMIDHEAAWDRNCAPKEIPQFAFEQQPAHGSISIAPMSFTIRQAQAGGAQCVGRPASGEALYYTSQPGFHGTDTVRFTTTFPNGVVLNHEATILVR